MANVWTPEEDARLKELYDVGTSAKEMAAILDRPKASVSQRISKLGFAAAKRAESSTPIPPKPDPVEPVAKRRYKIRYLVDGVEERTIPVIAKDEKTAKAGLLKELDKINDLRTYEIIRVEDVELVVPGPDEDARVKEFAKILASVNAGAKANTLKAPELVKEIQDGVDKVVQLVQEKEDELMQCKDGVCEIPLAPREEKMEEIKMAEERRINLSDFHQVAQQVAPVSLDSKMRLVLFGKAVSDSDTKEIVQFIRKVAPRGGMMENKMTLLDAITRCDELTEMMKDDLKIAAEDSVAKELSKDIEAMQMLQQAAWVILLGKTGGMKVV